MRNKQKQPEPEPESSNNSIPTLNIGTTMSSLPGYHGAVAPKQPCVRRRWRRKDRTPATAVAGGIAASVAVHNLSDQVVCAMDEHRSAQDQDPCLATRLEAIQRYSPRPCIQSTRAVYKFGKRTADTKESTASLAANAPSLRVHRHRHHHHQATQANLLFRKHRPLPRLSKRLCQIFLSGVLALDVQPASATRRRSIDAIQKMPYIPRGRSAPLQVGRV